MGSALDHNNVELGHHFETKASNDWEIFLNSDSRKPWFHFAMFYNDIGLMPISVPFTPATLDDLIFQRGSPSRRSPPDLPPPARHMQSEKAHGTEPPYQPLLQMFWRKGRVKHE